MKPIDDLHRHLRAITGCPGLRPTFLLRTAVREETGVPSLVSGGGGILHVQVEFPCGVREEHFLQPAADGAVIWRRRIENRAGATVQLVETAIRLDGLELGPERAQDWFYHTENPRIYGRMAIPVALRRSAELVADSGFDVLSGNRWSDPGVVSERIGVSPYQPVPALLVGNRACASGLVHGSLSQRVFCHGHELRHVQGGLSWTMISSLKGVAARTLEPGEVLDHDSWYLGHCPSHDIGEAFAGWAQELRGVLGATAGRSAANRHQAIWGSWNGGIHRDIDQERLLRQAAFLRRHLPTVAWLQIDDGWARLPQGLGAAYDPEDGVDRAKFPDGLRAFTDRVREHGLRPALWLGGWIPRDAAMAKEHAEWFIDYSYRITSFRILDVSLPEVRAYMTRALDRLVADAGFEGVKLDFWSYVFEDRHDLLADRHRTGHEWRSWWTGELRDRLPGDGFLQTGCDICMGNPFLGQAFNNYRYGIDVGGGKWENMRTCLQWGYACFASRTGDLFVPNSDAVCLFENLPDHEVLTWTTYCIISRSLCEVGGWLDGKQDHPRFRWLRKSLACLNNGEEVHFARHDYRTQDEAPAVWWLRTPYFSRCREADGLPLRTVALFNLEDRPCRRGVSAADLGLAAGAYRATEVWSGVTCDLADLAAVEVPAHAARLYTIAPAGRQAVLDADHEVAAVERAGGALVVRLLHPGPLELLLAERPAAVEHGGALAGLRIEPGQGHWVLRADCTGAARVELR